MELGVSGQSHFGGQGFQISDLGVRGCEGLGEAGDMSNSAPQDSDFLGRAKVCRCPTFPPALVCTVLAVVGGESGCAAADFTHRNTHAHIQTHTHTQPFGSVTLPAWSRTAGFTHQPRGGGAGWRSEGILPEG